MKKLLSYYVVIPAIALLMFFAKAYFTLATGFGLPWFLTLNKPSFTPPVWLFPVVYVLAFSLLVIALLQIAAKFQQSEHFFSIMRLYIFDAFLFTLWSYLFFYLHLIGASFINMAVVLSISCLLTLLIWRVSARLGQLAMVYCVVVFFSTYFNFLLLLLN